MNKKILKLRTWIQALWTLITNGYIYGFVNGKIFQGNTKMLCVPGLNCYACPGALGSCPIGSLQAVISNKSLNLSYYVIGILLFLGIILGRIVCGFLCPFGFFQDILYKTPFKNKRKNLPGHKYLKYLKYFILITFVIILPLLLVNSFGIGKPWFCKYICPQGILSGGLPLLLTNQYLRNEIGILFFLKLSILITLSIMSMKIYRPFCKYICPLGAIYGLLQKYSIIKIHIDSSKCIKCGVCHKKCKMDVEVYKSQNSAECIRCGECIKCCPKKAIKIDIKDCC